MSVRYLKTDVGPHLIDCLSFLDGQSTTALHNERALLWVIVASAATIQAACVLYINERESTSLPVLNGRSRKAWLECYEKRDFSEYMGGRLAHPRDLLKEVRRRDRSLIDDHSHNRLIRTLELRNNIVHFTPKSWSLEIGGIPELALEATGFANSVLSNPGLYSSTRLSDVERNRAKSYCVAISKTARQLASAFESDT